VAALAALDAEIVLQSVRGERRVPLAHFYTGYKKSARMLDEVIVRMDAHLPRLGAHWVWRKVGTRLAQAISKVALAGIAEVRNGRLIRLGFGMASVAPTTAFLSNVKALALSGPLSSITDAALDSALELDIAPIDDIRSTAAYRRHVAHALLRNFFAELRES
jgi:CO/xanthine dehydrogenase FAD-binding subunit